MALSMKWVYKSWHFLITQFRDIKNIKQGHFLSIGKWLDEFYIIFGPVLVLN